MMIQQLGRGLLAASLLFSMSTGVQAQSAATWPSKPIRVVVPFTRVARAEYAGGTV